MSGSVKTVHAFGVDGIIVEVECHLSNNLPAIVIVGSVSKAVDEARERVRAAYTNSSLELPRKKITINLAPADLPKADTSFDLAIAASILLAGKQVRPETFDKTLLIGELGLGGEVRGARGIIGKLLAGRAAGYTRFILPAVNLPQALLVPHITLLPIDTLKQLYEYGTSGDGIVARNTGEGELAPFASPSSPATTIDDVIGQAHAKRALVIAAAGGHNVFLSGPPGTGKSMLAKALPSLMPPLTHEESLEVTQLHSLVTSQFDRVVVQRPFRAPHHSASLVAIVGGGLSLRPGEISLSHRGVLFLDELPEFGRMVLEALRQPLEDRVITVSRAKDTITYPSQFILVATANPCPCGYYGTAKPCTCLPHQIVRYQQRVSGPILDRIDLQTTVQDVDHKNLLATTNNGARTNWIKMVTDARSRQSRRFKSTSKLNADMTNAELKRAAHLAPDAKDMLDTAAVRLNISARSYMKIVKVARTIADLDASDTITSAHIAEALQYRRNEQPVAA